MLISHTDCFITENTKQITAGYLARLGYWAVFFFFIVSGFLMVYICAEKEPTQPPGKSAFDYVIRKFKGFSAYYILAVVFALIVFIVFHNSPPKHIIIKSIPWFLGIEQAGLGTTLVQSIQLWYISAMLICMLPLYYMLQKNKDFYLYVFSPLISVLLYGYMYNQMQYLANQQFNGLVYNGILRALHGLCVGALCWLMYSAINKNAHKKAQRILLTIIEPIIYVAVMWIWFDINSDNHMNYAITILLPIAVAISFSGKSYISSLFKSDFWKHASKWSLMIYFYHYAAIKAIDKLFSDASYKESVLYSFIATIIFCIAAELIVYLFKKLWQRKLKTIFSTE